MQRKSRYGVTLTASDVETIGRGATTLPDNWCVDPIIDLTRPGRPRVWVRQVDDVIPPISFERLGSIIWVSTCDNGQHGDPLLIGEPFQTIAAAFVHLWGRLAAATTNESRLQTVALEGRGADHRVTNVSLIDLDQRAVAVDEMIRVRKRKEARCNVILFMSR